MPVHQAIIELPNFNVSDPVGWYLLSFEARYEGQNACPHCGCEKLRKKDVFWRKVRHICVGDRLSELKIKAHKFICLGCKKYFNQRFPGILPYKRATESFRRDVFQQHHDGITQKTLADRMRLGQATIERWYHDYIKLEDAKINRSHCPKVLGIDEHFFTRKKGYATTFADLTKHRVFDVVLGRSEASLKAYLSKLPGRHNVRVVVMDLSETYRSIIKKYFPNAMIVSDRFHVIRLINQHFMNTWKLLDPEGRKNRGLLSLMRRHRWNLEPKQIENLQKYLEKFPGLQAVYEFKQNLCELLLIKKQTAKQCRRHIPKLLQSIEQLKDSGFDHLKALGKTLNSWKEEIMRMWRFTKTNSITEGLHNKMEMLSRRAFGFRNFENYRLRVRVHCG
jgi:transposase